ncbi:ASKHA domain-containing protein [Chloroflexota bacterium]
MNYQIDFEPMGRRVPCQYGSNVFEVARDAGVELSSFCGGEGTCGKCRIRILSGRVSPLTDQEKEHLSQEDIDHGYRLACLTKAQESLKVEIPPEHLLVLQRLQLVGREREFVVDPVVETYHVTLPKSSLADIRSDQVRILDCLADNYGLKDIDIDFSVQCHLPTIIRANEWQAKVGLRDREIVTAGGAGDRLLGLAVDLGTTKIAAYLVDLDTGGVLAAKASVNHQVPYGEDVVSRISYAIENEGEVLRQTAVQDINTLIDGLCVDGGVASNNIAEVVVVSNTAMHHLFLGLPVRQLALSPFIPAISTSIDIKAREIGLATAPGAYIHLLPNIAGFVGADHVAMLLATGIYDTDKTVLGLDIGTNTEITLASRGKLKSCSCASGPAFEGAHIKDGMRATGGAIEMVRVTGSSVHFKTIYDKPPIGLCGSGILDAIAQLLKAGIIDNRGKLQQHPRVYRGKGGQEFVLVPKEKSGSGRDITLTEKDISQVQLAKGAIYAGITILLDEQQVGWEEVDDVIIAGAFGSYINVTSAIEIGMLPPLPVDRFLQVGNAAGVGAKLALVSRKQRQLSEEIAQKVQYVELIRHPQYSKIFAHALRF